MLIIRLQRVGRKHEPVFRLVVTDSKNSTKSGKTLETLGSYDARHGEQAVINTERVTYWMGQGAQTSDTVHNMLVHKKIITGKKVNALPLKKAIVKDAPAEAPAPVAASVVEAAPVAAPETVVEESTPVLAEDVAPEAPAEETVA